MSLHTVKWKPQLCSLCCQSESSPLLLRNRIEWLLYPQIGVETYCMRALYVLAACKPSILIYHMMKIEVSRYWVLMCSLKTLSIVISRYRELILSLQDELAIFLKPEEQARPLRWVESALFSGPRGEELQGQLCGQRVLLLCFLAQLWWPLWLNRSKIQTSHWESPLSSFCYKDAEKHKFSYYIIKK